MYTVAFVISLSALTSFEADAAARATVAAGRPCSATPGAALAELVRAESTLDAPGSVVPTDVADTEVGLARAKQWSRAPRTRRGNDFKLVAELLTGSVVTQPLTPEHRRSAPPVPSTALGALTPGYGQLTPVFARSSLPRSGAETQSRFRVDRR